MDKRKILENKYLEKRRIKKLKKTHIHKKIEETLRFAWSSLREVLDLKDIRLRIVLKGSCFFKNFPERVIQIGLESINLFCKELRQNKILISNEQNLAIYVLLHELGHFLDKRRFKRTVKKNEALRKAKTCLQSKQFDEFKYHKRLVNVYILRIENRAWEIAEKLISIFTKEQTEFLLVKSYSVNTYIRHLS